MKKAFTLIELLVVVLIIGILSAIALPQYTKAVEKSRIAEAKIALKALSDAQDVWVLETGGEDLGCAYDFDKLNYMPSGTHTKVSNTHSHVTSKNWDIYLDESACGSNTGGCCCDMYADRIGKDYSVRLVGSNYGGEDTPGVFYCWAKNDSEDTTCPQYGATKNADGDWVF